MKILKYLLIIILILVAVFFIRGLLTPSIYYESEVMVKKSLEESWAVMSDQSRAGEWISGYVKSELISGDGNTVGSVSNVHIDNNGTESIIKETITNIKPNEVIAMDFTMDFMDMGYEMRLEEKDEGTLIRSKSTTSGNGLFAKSMISFMKSAMKAQEDENLGNLKKVIESNTKNYFPDPKPSLEIIQ